MQRARALADRVRALDHHGRAITSSVPTPGGHPPDNFSASFDVVSYNYACGFSWTSGCDFFEHSRERLHGQPLFVSTESLPQQSAELWGAIEQLPWLLGDFVWSAWSYMGESALGAEGYAPTPRACKHVGWPYHTSSSGDVDIVGVPRAQAAYRRVLFNVSSLEVVVHAPSPKGAEGSELIHPWGWPDERQTWSWKFADGRVPTLMLRVFCRCDAVVMTLNGEALTSTPTPVLASNLTAVFSVAYVHGHLEAMGMIGGRVVANASLTSAGTPVAISLQVEEGSIIASRDALAHVHALVVDAAGEHVPWAVASITFDLDIATPASAVAEIVAVGNGDPSDVSSFQQRTRRTYRGRCMAIVRPGNVSSMPKASTIVVLARASGLRDGRIAIALQADSKFV